MNRRQLLTSALSLLPALALPRGAFAQAGPPSEDDIAKALKPRRKRGPKPPEEIKAAQTIEDLRQIRRKRGLNAQESAMLFQTSQAFPSLDLEVFFAFDSAAIDPEAKPMLDNLGRAIKRDDFAGTTIVVGGHTDAKGTEGYNQSLSEKRAEAIVNHLVSNFGLASDKFLATGYGFRYLKVSGQPLDPKNRRVQITAVPN